MDGVLAKVWRWSLNEGRDPVPNSEFRQRLFDSKRGTIKTVLPLPESKRQNNAYRCPKATYSKVIKSLNQPKV